VLTGLLDQHRGILSVSPFSSTQQVIALHFHQKEDIVDGNRSSTLEAGEQLARTEPICDIRESVWPVTRPVQVMREWCPGIKAHHQVDGLV
jgi:hypothetical protein